MEARQSPLIPAVDDSDHDTRVRKFAWIVLVVLVLALVSTFIVAGAEYLHVVAWLLIPGGLGIFRAIQLLRHPERVGRVRKRREVDGLLDQVDIHIPVAVRSPDEAEARLNTQDALDSVRQRGSTPRMRVAGQVAAGIGTVGWLTAAINSLAVGPDFVSAGVCLMGAAAFGSLAVYLIRAGRRLKRAERVFEEQLRSLKEPASQWVGPGDALGEGDGEASR